MEVEPAINYSTGEKALLKVKITFWLLLFRDGSFCRSPEEVAWGNFPSNGRTAAALMQLRQHPHKYETVELKRHS